MAISFEHDIRPLFRDKDIAAMRSAGAFDLSSHADVAARADAILQRLESGSMPCDGRWAVNHLQLFRQWITDGRRP